MKKILIIAFLMLAVALYVSAQMNYRDLLVRGQRTYWAILGPKLIIKYNDSIINNRTESGMRLDQDGHFEWYFIEDNDTLSLKDLAIDIEEFVSYRTYELHQDTIFIMSWPNYLEPSEYDDAYKILYITEQKMLLLPLTKNKNGNWVENTDPPHHRIKVREYRYMGKP